MTPAAIRESAGETYFLVVCDGCHGHMFQNGILCPKCNGDGRLLVHDKRLRVSVYVSKRTLKSALVAIAAVCLLVGAVISILK